MNLFLLSLNLLYHLMDDHQNSEGWGCDLVVEFWPSICEALCSISSTTSTLTHKKINEKKNSINGFLCAVEFQIIKKFFSILISAYSYMDICLKECIILMFRKRHIKSVWFGERWKVWISAWRGGEVPGVRWRKLAHGQGQYTRRRALQQSR